MYYLSVMLRVLRLDETVYEEIHEKELAFKYGHVNFLIVAIIYGFSSIILLPYILEDVETTELFILQGFTITAGIFIAFLLYLSAAGLLWAFCKGFGAGLYFKLIYSNFGVALIPLWFAMPGLALIMAGVESSFLYAYTIITTAYLLPTVLVATKNASGLPYSKVIFVILAIVLFLAGFIYLWLA